MNRITWDYYDVRYRKRRCQVLIPEDTSQIWVTQYSGMGQGGMDFDLYYCYDTIFLNFFSFKYAKLASDMDSFLESDLENIFLDDMIRNDHRLRGENYLWLYGWKKGFEAGVFFWDDEIYQMEGQRKQK